MLLYRREGSSQMQILGTQVIVGIGGGLLNVPVQLGVQASASHQEVAAATAMFLTSMEMGGAVGAAISGAVWTHSIPRKLLVYLPEETRGEAEEIFGKLTKALSYPFGSPTRIAINRAYQETMNKLLVLAIIASIPLIPLSLLMVNYRLDKVTPAHDFFSSLYRTNNFHQMSAHEPNAEPVPISTEEVTDEDRHSKRT